MDKMSLADVIAKMRSDLQEAQAEGEGQRIRFEIDTVQLELEVAITNEGSGKAGVRFWIVDASAEGKLSNAAKQKISLNLKVVDTQSAPDAEGNARGARIGSAGKK